MPFPSRFNNFWQMEGFGFDIYDLLPYLRNIFKGELKDLG